MNKYACMQYGEVAMLLDSELEVGELAAIYGTDKYWIDVTHVKDIDVGYTTEFDKRCGVIFVPPKTNARVIEYKKKEKLMVLENLVRDLMQEGVIVSVKGVNAILMCDTPIQYFVASIYGRRDMFKELCGDTFVAYGRRPNVRECVKYELSYEETCEFYKAILKRINLCKAFHCDIANKIINEVTSYEELDNVIDIPQELVLDKEW